MANFLANRVKFYLSLLLVYFAVSVTFISQGGPDRLFPWLPVVTIIGFGVLLLLVAVGVFGLKVTLIFSIVASIVYRLIVFLAPAGHTMITYDPDKFAVAINIIIRTGSTNALQSPIYSVLSDFHLFTASYALIAGLPGELALGIFPIAVGIFFPLFTAILVRPIAHSLKINANKDDLQRPMAYAAILASITTYSLWFSFGPIVQTFAVLLWLVFLVGVCHSIRDQSKRAIGYVLFIALILLTSHKLSVLIPLGMLVCMSLLIIVSPSKNIREIPFKLILVMLGIAVLQLIYLTRYVVSIYYLLRPGLGAYATTSSKEISFTSAIEIKAGILNTIARNISWITLVSLAGIVAVVVCWQIYRSDTSHNQTYVLLGAALLCGPGTIVGLLSSIAPNRIAFFGEVVFVAFIVAGGWAMLRSSHFSVSPYRTRATKVGIGVVFAFLLISQLFAPLAVPNSPLDQRSYLNHEEVSAKRYAQSYASQSATDSYYQREVIEFENPNAPETAGPQVQTPVFTSFPTEVLLNGTITTYNSSHITIREDLEPIRQIGFRYWQLTYDPESILSRNRSKVYANGGVSSFWSGHAKYNSSQLR